MFMTTDFVNADIAAYAQSLVSHVACIKPKSNKVSKRRSSAKIVNIYDTL